MKDLETFDSVSLYNDHDKEILKIAEDSLDSRLDRVQEIIEYAKEAGLKKIGIAHCTVFNKKAHLMSEMLINEGFEVDSVNCKHGKIPFADLVPGYKGISCNPAGQAKYLEEKGTELNIMMGLCLGHDMIFNAKSAAPVTPLVVKDRVLRHKTIEVFKKDID
jgi:uncharacterized metal-binding protein